MTLRIGSFEFNPPLALAPMAGISDLPFRALCRNFGASLTIAEMTAAREDLARHRRSILRNTFGDEARPHTAQILGNNPQQMADYARFLVDQGVDIIDINLGCPARKVWKKKMGAALLSDLALVNKIVNAVASAVTVPVTVKTRTGLTPAQPTALQVAQIAQDAGLAAITIHGRSARCAWSDPAQYQVIAQVKQSVSIPVIANGDIDSAQKAAQVLDITQADALMIGRAARGNPMIFKQVEALFKQSSPCVTVAKNEIKGILVTFLKAIHAFYGERNGVAIAKKHIRWFALQMETDPRLLNDLMKTNNASDQLLLVSEL